jgi:hypothetical protein
MKSQNTGSWLKKVGNTNELGNPLHSTQADNQQGSRLQQRHPQPLRRLVRIRQKREVKPSSLLLDQRSIVNSQQPVEEAMVVQGSDCKQFFRQLYGSFCQKTSKLKSKKRARPATHAHPLPQQTTGSNRDTDAKLAVSLAEEKPGEEKTEPEQGPSQQPSTPLLAEQGPSQQPSTPLLAEQGSIEYQVFVLCGPLPDWLRAIRGKQVPANKHSTDCRDH